jgi:hypothetical protein
LESSVSHSPPEVFARELLGAPRLAGALDSRRGSRAVAQRGRVRTVRLKLRASVGRFSAGSPSRHRWAPQEKRCRAAENGPAQPRGGASSPLVFSNFKLQTTISYNFYISRVLKTRGGCERPRRQANRSPSVKFRQGTVVAGLNQSTRSIFALEPRRGRQTRRAQKAAPVAISRPSSERRALSATRVAAPTFQRAKVERGTAPNAEPSVSFTRDAGGRSWPRALVDMRTPRSQAQRTLRFLNVHPRFPASAGVQFQL